MTGAGAEHLAAIEPDTGALGRHAQPAVGRIGHPQSKQMALAHIGIGARPLFKVDRTARSDAAR